MEILKNHFFFNGFKENQFDHVILVNVFSLIYESNLTKSYRMREEIILNLTRISKKTLVIVDSEAILNTGSSYLNIEQNNRAIFYDNILNYFTNLKMLDKVKIHKSGNSYLVLFEKNLNAK